MWADESALPVGACDEPGLHCPVTTQGSPCPIIKSWDCACGAAGWSCTVKSTSKLDCPPPVPVEGTQDASVADATETGGDGRVPYRALAVITGEVHSCALLDDHNVKCWGDNSMGQLGLGDTGYRGRSAADMGDALPVIDLGTGRTASEIAASRFSTCAILDDGSIKCWGWSGLNGQPALGSIGDEPGELGDHLPPLDLGGRRAVHLGMGNATACAVMTDATVWCWGGTAATLAPHLTAVLPAGKQVVAMSGTGDGPGGALALYDDGTVGAFGGSTTPSLPPGRKAVAIGGPCVVLDDGTTTCDASFDYSGIGPRPTGTVAVGAWTFTPTVAYLSADGIVRGADVQCGSPGPDAYWCPEAISAGIAFGQRAVALTSGGQHFGCALLADGGIKCWGGTGQLWMPDPWLGADITFTQTDAGFAAGPWREVDLGSRPPR
jgi:hypothetical protein